MDLQLMKLRKRAGYRNRDDFAAALGINKHTYKSWETGAAMMSLAQACRVAEVLDCSLDELAGRWEYVKEPKYFDPRQEALNGHFASLNEEGKDDLLKFAKSFAADPERRTVKDSTNTVADSVHVA